MVLVFSLTRHLAQCWHRSCCPLPSGRGQLHKQRATEWKWVREKLKKNKPNSERFVKPKSANDSALDHSATVFSKSESSEESSFAEHLTGGFFAFLFYESVFSNFFLDTFNKPYSPITAQNTVLLF